MISYRAWEIWARPGVDKPVVRLMSMLRTTFWERDMAAVCSEPGNPVQEHLRNMEHTCGIYSVKEPEDLPDGPIYGTIFNYGTVAIYSKGYRSSHAMIDTLFIIPVGCVFCEEEEAAEAEFVILPTAEDPPFPYYTCPLHLNQILTQRRFTWRPPVSPTTWGKLSVVWHAPPLVWPIEAIYRELSTYYQVPVTKPPKIIQDLFF